MSISVRRADLWRAETANTPGSLASALKPLAEKGTDLEIVMGYATPDRRGAVVEVSPVSSPADRKAARAAGLSQSSFPCVVISGGNRPGLGYDVAQALAEAGININFFVAQSLGDSYTGLFSFEASTEADLAVRIIRKAVGNTDRATVSKRAPAGGRPKTAAASKQKRVAARR